MKRLYLLLGLVLCLLACRKETDLPPTLTGDGFEQRKMVPLEIYLGVDRPTFLVDGEVVDHADTKAAGAFPYSQSDLGDDRVIYNLWILEFEQEGDAYVLNAQPTYVADYPSYFDDSGNAIKTIGVPASRRRCTLLFMANTGLPDMTFNPGTTLEQFKEARFAEIDHQADLFGWDEDAGKYAPRFNGTIETYVNTSTNTIGTKDARIPLRRAMARVTITVTNLSLRSGAIPSWERIHLRHVRMNNVQNKSFYYTNYPDYDNSVTLNRPTVAVPLSVSMDDYDWGMDTHVAEDWSRMIGYSEWYNSSGVRMDPQPATADAISAALLAGSAPTVATARFFLPGNLRPETLKDATSITLVGEYTKDGHTYDVSYDIPIQENKGGKSYYAVRPNHDYTYNITLNRLGDTDVDPYASNGIVDFTTQELANSYMCHPTPIEDLSTVFQIPVMKGNLYWGDSRYDAGFQITYASSGCPSGDHWGRELVLGEDDPWQACILWSDFPLEDKVQLLPVHGDCDGDGIASPGEGKGADPSDKGYISVRIKGGTVGNVVIGVKKKLYNADKSKSDDFICWSWHLWITGYNPDDEVNVSPSQYTYTVTSGKVFRVNNEIFNNGIYKGSYLMDRAYGSWYDPVDLVSDYVSGNDIPSDIIGNSVARRPGMGMYYQYGRKDPLPCRNTVVYFPDGNTASGTVWLRGGRKEAMTRFVMPDQQRHRTDLYYSDKDYNNGYVYAQVPLTVMYPMIKPSVINDCWTYGDQYNPLVYNDQIEWNDPYFYEREDENAENRVGYHKSIFDPCPPGWVLPHKGKFIRNGSYGPMNYHLFDHLRDNVGAYKKYWEPLVVNGVYRGTLLWPDGREIPNAEITSSMIFRAVFMNPVPVSEGGPFGFSYNGRVYMFQSNTTNFKDGQTLYFNKDGNLPRYDDQNPAGEHHRHGLPIRCIKNVKPE